ncbi:MAG: hypothetical protein J6R17_01360 [Bacteroidales bacterium]|nr:hypothetical protein [Bacteroidales bacterium]
MISNNSGKFSSPMSNYVGEGTTPKLPTAPMSSTSGIGQFIEEYFGRFWWVWLIVFIIIKNK